MSTWDDYKREAPEKVEGKTRCVIVDVEDTVSKKGMPMIVVSVRPSGTKFRVKWYLVKNDSFNRNATNFFDAIVGVDDGDFDFVKWIGCEIGAMLGEDDQGYTKVKYWLNRSKLEALPPFEGEKPERQEVTKFEEEDDGLDDLPFTV